MVPTDNWNNNLATSTQTENTYISESVIVYIIEIPTANQQLSTTLSSNKCLSDTAAKPETAVETRNNFISETTSMFTLVQLLLVQDRGLNKIKKIYQPMPNRDIALSNLYRLQWERPASLLYRRQWGCWALQYWHQVHDGHRSGEYKRRWRSPSAVLSRKKFNLKKNKFKFHKKLLRTQLTLCCCITIHCSLASNILNTVVHFLLGNTIFGAFSWQTLLMTILQRQNVFN